MLRSGKKKGFEQTLLLHYYESEWIRGVNLILFFIVEVTLCILLTLLPIKITFHWILKYALQSFDGVLDILFLVIFILHIYLYLQNKLKMIIENPEADKEIKIRSRRIKIRWLSVLSVQLVYDLVCLGVAIFQFNVDQDASPLIPLQYIYIFQLYKIQIFRNTVQSYIIGTSFNALFNVIEGILILFFFVCYVGCIFYQIDRTLYDRNYQYQELLWVVNSAWPDIIDSSFGIQILYSIYWSIGTASTAAYGNVSASSPYDVIYNIFCLYFEGFLFGFYLSRFQSVPQLIAAREEQLLEIFYEFEDHKQEIRKNNSDRNQQLQKQLYLKILCSLEYQDDFQHSTSSIQEIIPLYYKTLIKTDIFRCFLNTNPLNLLEPEPLQHRISLQIMQALTQTHEEIYNYKEISYNSLVYVHEGSVSTSILIDDVSCGQCIYENGSVLGVYNFVTNAKIPKYQAKCLYFCSLYVLERKKYKECLSIQQKIKFLEAYNSIISCQDSYTKNQSIGKIGIQMGSLMNPNHKQNHIRTILQKSTSLTKKYQRSSIKSSKIYTKNDNRTKTVGVQCNIRTTKTFQTVLILD